MSKTSTWKLAMEGQTQGQIVREKINWLKRYSEFTIYGSRTLRQYRAMLRSGMRPRSVTPEKLISKGIMICTECNQLLPLEYVNHYCTYCGEGPLLLLRK